MHPVKTDERTGDRRQQARFPCAGAGAPGGQGVARGGRGDDVAPRCTAREAIFRLLARREYSRKELRDRLARRNHAPEAIEEALARMAEEGYQSDERYALSLVRFKSPGRGGRRLRQDLALAGVRGDLAEQALAAAGSEVERCVAMLRRHEGKAPDAALRQRVTRWLAGRGFGFDAIGKAWKVVFEGADIDDFMI